MLRTKRKRKSRSTVGLKNNRVDWYDPVNAACYALARKGVHAAVIAERTGLTTGQVYSRCRYLGVRLTDYRKGLTEEIIPVLEKYDVLNWSHSPTAVKKAFNDVKVIIYDGHNIKL